MAAFQMTDSQQTTLTIAATDKKGNKATLPTGSVVWAVDQVSLIALTPAADGMSAVAAAVGPLGTATVSVKVVDGNQNTLASGTLDITIVGGGATTIVVTPGTATEQP